MYVEVSFGVGEPSDQYRLPRVLVRDVFIAARLRPIRGVEPGARAGAIRPSLFVGGKQRDGYLHSPPNVPPAELVSGVHKRSPARGSVLRSLTPIEYHLPHFKRLSCSIDGGR